MAPRARLLLAARVAFAVAGVAFLAIAFRNTWDRSRGAAFPSWPGVAVAGVLVLAGLGCAAASWIALLPGRARAGALARGFYTGQLGKYVPGAVWQAIGQVGFAVRDGVSLPHASAAFPVHALTQVAAAAAVGATLVAMPSVPAPARAASGLGLVSLLLLHRSWMAAAARVAARALRRSFPDDLVPPQRAILRSFAWSILTLVFSGAAFSLLLSSLTPAGVWLRATAAFSTAWVAGFLALPFPSGLGVREAVLIGVLGGSAGTASVIAASIAHRLVTIVGEMVMVAVGKTIHRDR